MAETSTFKVCVTSTELHHRGRHIIDLVKILLKKPTDVYPIARNINPERIAWTVQKSGTNPQGSHKDLRFPTNVDGITANYFEQWVRFYKEEEEFWYLELAYLHLYKTDRLNKTAPEYLLLHCDPNERREHAKYKQSPHLHIEVAPPPWPKAHIALNVGYLEPLLQDASSLTANLFLAIEMLKDQILDELPE